MSGKLEELEKLLAKKVERNEEWDVIEIEDVKPINISKIRESVKNGKPLSEEMRKDEVFSAMVTQLVSVGEEIGNLPEMFRRINQFYSNVIKAKIERMLALFEPFMIVIMGIIIGSMVISMYLPIFKIATLAGK